MSVNQVLNNLLLPNVDKPFVSITHNCLDGNFAYPGWNALGETLQRVGENSESSALYRNTGSAAHFGATGLGFLEEHEAISDKLVEGIFDKGLTVFGDAINYSKIEYIKTLETNLTITESELYSYNLLGDPAMVLFKADTSSISTSVSKSPIEPDDEVVFTFELNNNSDFTASADTTFSFTLPADFNYDGIVIDYSGPHSDDFNNPANFTLEPVTVSNSTDQQGNEIITVTAKKALEENQVATGGIPANGSMRIRIYATAKSQLANPSALANYAFESPGSESIQGNLFIDLGSGSTIYLPIILNQ